MSVAMEGKPPSGNYLVLGGSRGIGFAYAESMACSGTHLTIVGRNQSNLDSAANCLRDKGASVTCDSLDLTDRRRRRKFLSTMVGECFTGIFVGGPSPKSGPYSDDITETDVSEAFEICIRYPTDVVETLALSISSGGHLVLLSSSASKEPLINHSFFLSALFRRGLDELAKEWGPIIHARDVMLALWRPTLVLTPLAIAYGKRCGAATSVQESIAWLEKKFATPDAPTPTQYVAQELARL